ncbi:hypothetical protein LY78DRAFT_356983 [Colletotrichum sublineola]|nr:hypothetical protein LY78DRAFT_356983 [Colletotrichum sublineola]
MMVILVGQSVLGGGVGCLMYLRMRPSRGHFGWRCLFAELAVRDSAILEQPETLQGC